MNVLISSLAGRWASTVLTAMKQGQLRLIVSSALLGELRDVISRPRMRKWFDLQDGDDMAAALESQATVVEPQITVTACRDPDDNYLWHYPRPVRLISWYLGMGISSSLGSGSTR